MIHLRPSTCRYLHALVRRQLIFHRTTLPYRLYATVEPHPAAPQSSSHTSSQPSPVFPNIPNGATNDSSSSSSTPPPPPPPPPPNPKRSLRPLIYATIFVLLGLTAGQLFRFTILPPPLPHPSTPEDTHLLAALSTTCDTLPIIALLRAHPTLWKEWPAYSSLTPTERSHRLSSGPMSGFRGLAVQRVFWNVAESRAISVVFFGSGLCGWPGVTHGGAIATVMDESLGRVAVRGFKAKTGVTANLELDYRRPVLVGRFYVLRAEAVEEGRGERKMWVRGCLEDLEGRVCVEGKALFVVPKGVELGEIKEGF